MKKGHCPEPVFLSGPGPSQGSSDVLDGMKSDALKGDFHRKIQSLQVPITYISEISVAEDAERAKKNEKEVFSWKTP